MPGRPSPPRPRPARAVIAAAVVTAALLLAPAEADVPADGPAGTPAAPGSTPGGTPGVTPGAAAPAAARGGTAGGAPSDAAAEALRAVPRADWLVSGGPEDIRRQVREATERAEREDRTPVLVAYHLPWRDCSGHSAGGAAGVTEYGEWIGAVAEGIGARDAVVVLEPDSLGLIPWYTEPDGEPAACRPDGADPATAAGDRFAMLRHAVDTLKALPRTRVYLDGTHSGWLDVGRAAERLVRAGVREADGFALNVSNFETTGRQLAYGRWISKCVHYGTSIEPGNFAGCASQYHPADPDDVSTWGRTDAWYAEHVDGRIRDGTDLAHFVVDTSRNGRGPWTPERSYPDPQAWCNPPGRGTGLRPTTDTGHPLADAFLWIKVPGESDGACDRGLGSGTPDPEWGVVPPPAGGWFPEQAADLVRHADPAFED